MKKIIAISKIREELNKLSDEDLKKFTHYYENAEYEYSRPPEDREEITDDFIRLLTEEFKYYNDTEEDSYIDINAEHDFLNSKSYEFLENIYNNNVKLKCYVLKERQYFYFHKILRRIYIIAEDVQQATKIADDNAFYELVDLTLDEEVNYLVIRASKDFGEDEWNYVE